MRRQSVGMLFHNAAYELSGPASASIGVVRECRTLGPLSPTHAALDRCSDPPGRLPIYDSSNFASSR